MTCTCCTGRSKVVTTDDAEAVHGRLSVTARYYWLSDTGWSWCPEQITRVEIYLYGSKIDITHLLKPAREGDFHLVDTDLWHDIENVLENARLGLEEPNLKQEMTLDEFMMEVK